MNRAVDEWSDWGVQYLGVKATRFWATSAWWYSLGGSHSYISEPSPTPVTNKRTEFNQKINNKKEKGSSLYIKNKKRRSGGCGVDVCGVGGKGGA